MPREWHDRHAANQIADPEKRRLYLKLVADKKPYFMRYVYPALMKQYNQYIKNTDKNAMREFQMSVSELMKIPESDRSDRQREFLRYYNMKMPVGTNDCVMNKICRRFESEFDGYLRKKNASSKFDYTIMKSGVEYSTSHYRAIEKLCNEYNQRLRGFVIEYSTNNSDEYDFHVYKLELLEEFMQACAKICPNKKDLCDIVLDICYRRSSTKRFAWDICADEIVENLLNRSGRTIRFPEMDPDGDIQFCGERFRMKQIQIGGNAIEYRNG